MNSIIRNPEFKAVAVKIFILQLVLSVIAFLFIRYCLSGINQSIINQDTAFAGQLLSKHPEMEEDIINCIMKKADAQQIKEGSKILSEYGYSNKIHAESQPVLRKLYPKYEVMFSLLILSFFIPIIMLLFFEYSKFFKKICQISNASEKMVEGQFDTVDDEDTEGDFGILKYNFSIMAQRLKLSMEKLNDDKIFLKNTIQDISHQLKTPLSSLIIFNDLLLQNRNFDEDTKLDFLNKSKAEIERMEWLILNLLKMARLEAGAVCLQKNRVSIYECINKVLIPLSVNADKKNIKIEITQASENICFIGDENWTIESFANIIKNCIEHTRINGNIKIEISGTPILSQVKITDNGEGIDKKDLSHIFERFYKGSNSVQPESIGIGLSLSKIIIEKQNGIISVKSKIGQGTQFIIDFINGVI